MNASCWKDGSSDEDVSKHKSCEDSHRTGHKSHSALGLIFPLYYQFDRLFQFDHFYIGLVYRPTFYRRNTSTDPFEYEHLISFEFGVKRLFN